MKGNDSQVVTQLLVEWSHGNEAALDQLMPIVYGELRRMAKRYMNSQDGDHTMQTTELIHEAYLKLAGNTDKDWESRNHFFGVAGQAMRHILVDYARTKKRKKRGGEFAQKITFIENSIVPNNQAEQVVALDNALNGLAKLDERSKHTSRRIGSIKTRN